MGSVTAADPQIERERERERERDPREAGPEGSGGGGPIASLGSWMAILGAIRLVCAIADYAAEWRAAIRMADAEAGAFWRYAAEHPPVHLLIAAWPAAIGLILLRSRWHELVKVGAVTFVLMSVCGILSAMGEWGGVPRGFVTIGSFRVSRLSLLWLSDSGLATCLAGAVQLLLELITGLRASAWAFRSLNRADGAEVDRREAARRMRLGRLALLGSLAFVVLTVRLPGWSPYLELATRSKFLRDLLIGENGTRHTVEQRPRPAPSAWLRDGMLLYDQASEDWAEGRYARSRDTYLRLMALLDPLSPSSLNLGERRFVCLSYNNLAWLLATCPDVGLRDGKAAVRFARRALEFAPNDGDTWNTLGVAYFRSGDMEQSRNALYRSMELQNEGTSHDWFFLAMIHQREGRKERAREWYNKAAQWSKQADPENEELYRFQCEAAEALGLPRPAAREHLARRSLGPTTLRPPHMRSRFRLNEDATRPR